MTLNYIAIRKENQKRYGTDIGRIGRRLLADRYDDRTHFIYELLQNAEDALDRRDGSDGPRAVAFKLSGAELRVSHFGATFTEADVRGICGIAEGNKDLTSIGRFSIGFKSVYSFTDCPEIHSGDEHFAIDSFVWPRKVPRLYLKDGETVFIIPLRKNDLSANKDITEGLRKIGPRTLLFLRQIEEISWMVESGPAGLYLRSELEPIGDNLRKVLLIGEQEGVPHVEERWLIFSREVWTDDGEKVGYIEVAFKLDEDDEGGPLSVEPLHESPLVVFFPTIVQTNLGFHVQGPYRTTPSRDNVPRNDPWNQHLVQETATLLVEALHWLRDHDLLDTAALRCLPLDAARFGEGSMFAPLFKATRDALKSGPLLPRFGGSHVSARKARLARTQELRELFSPRQLGTLFDTGGELAWLSSDITQDRTPELRHYLMHELDIAEVTPEMILSKLDKRFLKAQPNEWIRMLYEFLNGQPVLRRRVDDLPLIRLDDGAHVAARSNGQPQAFLPGEVETSFPTVHQAVCATEEARKFLQSLGLTEPDPVDDVIWNMLPKYRRDKVHVNSAYYAADISRILRAFGTDSKTQREKLLAALREAAFVMAVDAGDGSERVSKPGDLYLATERLKELFAGIAGVLLVDDAYSCLRGEDVRELLEACGASRSLQPVAVAPAFTRQQLREMRIAAGFESCTREEPIEDHTLRGLDLLLRTLLNLDTETRRKKASLLWESLGDIADRRGTGIFTATYWWTYYYPRSTTFDAEFVRKLNATAWVPDTNGELQRPEFVFFGSLSWKPKPLLLSKILFKPPIIETLAKEAGIEPGVLDLLKKLGVISEAELRARLGMDNEPETHSAPGVNDVNDAIEKLLGDSLQPTPPVPDLVGPEPTGSGSGRGGGAGPRGEITKGGGGGTREDMVEGDLSGARSQHVGAGVGDSAPGKLRGRPFISYVATHADDEEPDLDGLDQPARLALEEKAIGFIPQAEPRLQRTPKHNPGFDLYEPGPTGPPVRWIEVKAMTGGLHDRPVGLSRTQFECAQEHGEAYWLYVVEHAGDENRARIVRIQNPAGKARTFTFDHGWLAVAELVGGGASLVEEEESS